MQLLGDRFFFCNPFRNSGITNVNPVKRSPHLRIFHRYDSANDRLKPTSHSLTDADTHTLQAQCIARGLPHNQNMEPIEPSDKPAFHPASVKTMPFPDRRIQAQ